MGNAEVIKDFLPEDSLYAPVPYLYEARRGYSKKTAGPIPAEVFARRLVGIVPSPEVPQF